MKESQWTEIFKPRCGSVHPISSLQQSKKHHISLKLTSTLSRLRHALHTSLELQPVCSILCAETTHKRERHAGQNKDPKCRDNNNWEAAGAHARSGGYNLTQKQKQKRNTSEHSSTVWSLSLQVSAATEKTIKEDERLRLKQLSDERASKWPNTLQVGLPAGSVC